MDPDADVDWDAVADELYSLPRDEFTAARNAAAKRARERGRRELAERVGALRRPSTAAWLANLLAREQPEEVRALVELGDGLREAQQRLQGQALRRLSARRHELVHALVQQARSLGRSAGHPVSEAVTRELEATFTAAVNSSAAARALAGGRLTTALDPTALDPTALDPAALDPDLVGDVAVDVSTSAGRSDAGRSRRAERDERLRRELDRARSEAADADAAQADAQRALADAEQAAADAAQTLRELRARLEAAEQAEQEVGRAVRSAQRDVEVVDRTAREAQRRVHDLEHRLDPPTGR